jgi:restriction endonuclease S subunit
MMSEKCFVVSTLDNRTQRIDAHFFNPAYFDTVNNLEKLHTQNNQLQLSPLKKLLRNSKTNLTGGATPKGSPYVTEDEGIKFVRVQNVKKYKIDTDNIVYIPEAFHRKELKRSQLRPKDVLLTITGSYGISAFVPDNFSEANMNQHSVKIEVDTNKILPEYLCCFLNSKFAQVQMNKWVSGGTRPALDYPSVRAISILYPASLEKQRKVAERTLKHAKEAYEFKNKKESVLLNLDKKIINTLGIKLPDKHAEKYFIGNLGGNNRLDAIFYSPYHKKFIEAIKEHHYKPLRKLVEPAKNISPPIQDFYSVIDLRDIEEKTGRYDAKEVTDIGTSKIVLKYGNIFVSCLNPTKGKSLLINEELDGCIVSTEFEPLRITSKEVIPEYLVVILRSKIALTQWEYRITGSTPSRARIGDTELLNTLIPLPNKSTQREIADDIFADIKKISELEAKFDNLLEKADELFIEGLKVLN